MTVGVEPVSQFGVSAPATATAGSAFSVTLTAQDAGGNTVTSYPNGNHTIAWGGATTSPGGMTPTYPTTSVNFTNGVSTTALSATLVNAGTNSLTATSSGVTGSASVMVSQAAGSKLVYLTGAQTFVTGTGTTAGSGAISVQLQDTYGNPVAESANTGLTFTTGLSGVTYVPSYGSTTACTASTCTIPAGSSIGTFYMTDTSGGTDTITTTAGSLSTPSQSETAIAPQTAGGTVSTTSQSGTLSPTGTATYTVTVTNTTFSTERFEVLAGGLPSTATISPTTCVAIGGQSNSTWTVTVNNSSGNNPAGTSTFSLVAERFSSGSCAPSAVPSGRTGL